VSVAQPTAPDRSPSRHHIATVAHHFLSGCEQPSLRQSKGPTLNVVVRSVRGLVAEGRNPDRVVSDGAALWRDLGRLDEELVSGIEWLYRRAPTGFGSWPRIVCLGWCTPPAGALALASVYRLVRLVAACRPRRVIGLRLGGTASSGTFAASPAPVRDRCDELLVDLCRSAGRADVVLDDLVLESGSACVPWSTIVTRFAALEEAFRNQTTTRR
jgi:hypothetical protein